MAKYHIVKSFNEDGGNTYAAYTDNDGKEGDLVLGTTTSECIERCKFMLTMALKKREIVETVEI